MVKGRNYLTLNESERRLFSSSASQPCVFISHKKEDADFARHLSDYVMERGINVYFDENDPILAKEHKSPDEVVNAIKKGLEKSTHMIIVLSKKTLESNWVPWEVGFASAKDKEYRLLRLNDVLGEVPEFYKVAKILNDYDDLNKYLASMKKTQTNNQVSNDDVIRMRQLLERLDRLKKVYPY
jgi:hypothetical protein